MRAFSPMAEFFHRSDDVALNFRDEGTGPPVLLVHGVGASLQSWDGMIAVLGQGRRYVRFDLRGHGASARTSGPYALDDFVEDAIVFLDHLKIERVALVGFSLGGLIAQAIALAHAERLSGLALISTIAGRTPEEQARARARARTLAEKGANAHLAEAVERWFTNEFRATNPEVLEKRRLQSMANDPDCYAAAYRVLAENDLGERLREIAVPTLVLTGENDVGSPPRMARLMHERIAGSELKILPRLKHAVLLEAPGQIADCLDDFFDRRLKI